MLSRFNDPMLEAQYTEALATAQVGASGTIGNGLEIPQPTDINLMIMGTSGNDFLHGHSWQVDDYVYGGAGHDTLSSNGSADEGDRLYGGAGNDVLIAGRGTEIVDGGANIDTAILDFSTATRWVGFQVNAATTVNVNGGAGLQMKVTGIERVDITGGAFTDVLMGGALGDTINGGGGADQLWGDAGADIFVLRAGEATGDHIFDFDENVDTIHLVGYEAGAKLRKYTFDPATEIDPKANYRWEVYSDADADLVLDSFYVHAKLELNDNYVFI